MLPQNLKKISIYKRNYLIEQIYTTVRWRESLIKMFDDGNENFIEIGPGKVLTGMAKRTIENANCFSINSIADIKNLTDEFKNKKVLITGATGGIGKCLVEKFNNLGSKIIATGTNEEKLNNLKNNFPNVDVEKFRLNEHEKIENFIERIDKAFNGLEIFSKQRWYYIDNLSIRLSEENWNKVVDVNLTSTFLMCKFAIKKMLKQKKEK